MCVGNLTTIGSDNGLSPSRGQPITLTNAGRCVTLARDIAGLLVNIKSKTRLQIAFLKQHPDIPGTIIENSYYIIQDNDVKMAACSVIEGMRCPVQDFSLILDGFEPPGAVKYRLSVLNLN